MTLTPLADAEWPADLERLRQGFAGRLNVYRVMAHNPALLGSWESLRNHLVLESALTPVQLEIVTLRTGHRWGSSYEWAQHVVRGRQAGLTEDQIERCRQAPEFWAPDHSDTALMQAVDGLLDDGQLSEGLRNSLTRNLGSRAVLDIMATVGMYTTLAFILKTFDVPLEAEISGCAP